MAKKITKKERKELKNKEKELRAKEYINKINEVKNDLTQNTSFKESDENTWDQLTDTFTQLSEHIITFSAMVSALIKSQEINQLDEERKLLAFKLGNSCLKDCVYISTELKKIREKHKNKTGTIKTENELFSVIEITQDYYKLKEIFLTIINPIYTDLLTLAEMGRKIGEMKNEQ